MTHTSEISLTFSVWRVCTCCSNLCLSERSASRSLSNLLIRVLVWSSSVLMSIIYLTSVSSYCIPFFFTDLPLGKLLVFLPLSTFLFLDRLHDRDFEGMVRLKASFMKSREILLYKSFAYSLISCRNGLSMECRMSRVGGENSRSWFVVMLGEVSLRVLTSLSRMGFSSNSLSI